MKSLSIKEALLPQPPSFSKKKRSKYEEETKAQQPNIEFVTEDAAEVLIQEAEVPRESETQTKAPPMVTPFFTSTEASTSESLVSQQSIETQMR